MVFKVLTDRQAEYVRLYCAGRTNREIAQAWGANPHALHQYRSDVLTRTGAASIADVCRMIERGETPAPVLRNRKADTR